MQTKYVYTQEELENAIKESFYPICMGNGEFEVKDSAQVRASRIGGKSSKRKRPGIQPLYANGKQEIDRCPVCGGYGYVHEETHVQI